MAKGISLHFGINDYSFRGQNNLNACVNDAISTKGIADSLKYESYIFKDSDATYKNLVYSLIIASGKLYDGDILFLYFSGHGSQVNDTGNDEPDGLDNYILLYDDDFYDDELMILLKFFRPGVRVFCIFDACHSSTMVDTDVTSRNKNDIDRFTSKLTNGFRKYIETLNKVDLKCSVKSISGAWDLRTASDGDSNSLFTEYLLRVWDNGNYNKNIFSYFKDVRSKIILEKGSVNMPVYQKRGPGIGKFNTMRPYEI
jgi:hypothetical protein